MRDKHWQAYDNTILSRDGYLYVFICWNPLADPGKVLIPSPGRVIAAKLRRAGPSSSFSDLNRQRCACGPTVYSKLPQRDEYIYIKTDASCSICSIFYIRLYIDHVSTPTLKCYGQLRSDRRIEASRSGQLAQLDIGPVEPPVMEVEVISAFEDTEGAAPATGEPRLPLQ